MRKLFKIGMILYFFVGITSCVKEFQEPNVDLSSYQLIDPNLELVAVASEPLIIAPVAIDFDIKGRIWVAEMQDFMPDIDGVNENKPNGRILILEDRDKDGTMDHSIIFKDKIQHLRTIRLFNDGLLYADNEKLYFVDIKKDKPGNSQVIDSLYAIGGNVEHKSNSMLRAIDNCFYNAKSNFRYCFDDNKWTKESTSYRGQWGITSDENGRLYANDNSNFLFGDKFLPNTLIKNQFSTNPEELSFDLIGDRTVFPSHSTSVNRAYQEGTMDSLGRLIFTTSTCSPHIFQSEGLGEDYENSTFVCVPEANLIKHLSFDPNTFSQKAVFTYKNQEFLTSNDEAFRPVNFATGPDDALYIVDMHRGIIQHKTYMTQFLRTETLEKGLDTIVQYGRILKVIEKNKTRSSTYNFQKEEDLIKQLGSNNSWIRIKSQEMLITKKSNSIKSKLENLLQNGNKIEKLHALWTLTGRHELPLSLVDQISIEEDPWIIANFLKALDTYGFNVTKDELARLFEKLSASNEPIVLNHLLTSLNAIYVENPQDFLRILNIIMDKKGIEISANAIISAFPSGIEIDTSIWQNTTNASISLLNSKVVVVNENISKNKTSPIFDYPTTTEGVEKDGRVLYNNLCAICHGMGGLGIQNLAPALIKGKLVNSHKAIVPLIILNGLHGEITVDNKLVSFASEMPKLEKGAEIDAQEIAKLTNYIYNAFRDNIVGVNDSLVTLLMTNFGSKDKMWTEKELLDLYSN